MKPRHLFWLLVCLASSIAIPIFLSGTQLLPILAQMPLSKLTLLIGCICLSWLLQGNIILILLSTQQTSLPNKWRLLPYFLTAQFLNKVSPLGSGELAISYLLSKRYPIPIYRVLTSLLAAFILSLITITGWCCIIVISGYVTSQSYQLPMLWLLFSLITILLGFVTLFLQEHRLARLLLMTLKMIRMKPCLRFKSARSLLRLVKGMNKLTKVSSRTKVKLLLLSSAYWGTILSVLWASANLLGANIGWAQTATIQVLATVGGHLSLLPSGLVGTEAIAAWLLAPFLGSSLAGSAILLWRGLLLYLPMLAGVSCLLLLDKQLRNRNHDVPAP